MSLSLHNPTAVVSLPAAHNIDRRMSERVFTINFLSSTIATTQKRGASPTVITHIKRMIYRPGQRAIEHCCCRCANGSFIIKCLYFGHGNHQIRSKVGSARSCWSISNNCRPIGVRLTIGRVTCGPWNRRKLNQRPYFHRARDRLQSARTGPDNVGCFF